MIAIYPAQKRKAEEETRKAQERRRLKAKEEARKIREAKANGTYVDPNEVKKKEVVKEKRPRLWSR